MTGIVVDTFRDHPARDINAHNSGFNVAHAHDPYGCLQANLVRIVPHWTFVVYVQTNQNFENSEYTLDSAVTKTIS